MKTVTSTNVINFAVSGTSKYVITPEGVLVSDADARILAERLGSNITITDMEPDAIEVPVVAPEVEAPVAPPADETLPQEPMPAEVVAPEVAPEAPAEPTV